MDRQFAQEGIIGSLKEADARVSVEELYRRRGYIDAALIHGRA